VFAGFALAFALQLRKKHGKPSVIVRNFVNIVIRHVGVIIIKIMTNILTSYIIAIQ
jgi:hypothetical protein